MHNIPLTVLEFSVSSKENCLEGIYKYLLNYNFNINKIKSCVTKTLYS